MTLVRILAERGYALGKNLALDARGAKGKISELPHMLEEMKSANIDVIVTVGYKAALLAKATGIPVVIAFGSGDPVATGLVNSLARPGGTITGISDDAATISTKRLSLLKQLLPSMRRVAMLWNSDVLACRYAMGHPQKRRKCWAFVFKHWASANLMISTAYLRRWTANRPKPS